MTHFSDGLRVGGVFPSNVEAGAPTSPVFVYNVVPAALVANGVAAAQAVSGAANLTLNGGLATSGVATMDVPRAVSIVSSNVGDTTQTATVTGTGLYGTAVSEVITFNGTTTVNGKKAFKTVTRVAISAALVGNGTVGSTDILGLPYRADTRGYVLTSWDAAFVTTGTFVAAVTATATTTTGDTRGTFVPPSASDAARRLTAWIFMPAVDTQAGLYGVTQA